MPVITVLAALGLVGATLPSVAAPAKRPAGEAGPCFDPRRAGVAWDGTTDDSAAMTAALAQAIAEGGKSGACLQLPAGTGRLGNIVLPPVPDGLTIRGVGPGGTKVLLSSPTAGLFATTSTGEKNKNIDIGDFEILAPGRMTGGTTFAIDAAERVQIHDIVQWGGWRFLQAGASSAAGVVGARIYRTNLRSFGAPVFEFDNGNDLSFTDNAYDGLVSCPSTGAADPRGDYNQACQPPTYFLDRNTSGVYLSGLNDAIHCGTCYLFEPQTPGQSINWVFIFGAAADTSAGDGWVLHAPPGTKILGFHATQLWSSANFGHGFVVHADGGPIDDVNLTDPRLQDNRLEGLLFRRFDGTSTITNPTIAGNSQLKPGARSSMLVEAGSGNISVVGGRIGSDYMTYGTTAKANIETGGGWSGDIRVTTTNLCGSTRGPVADAGKGRTVITGSACAHPDGPAPVTVGPSPFAYQATISPTNVNLYGGAVSSVTLAGVTVCASSPCAVRAMPGQRIVVTYSAPPTMVVSKD